MKNKTQSVVLLGALLLLPFSAIAQSNERAAVDRARQKIMRGFQAGDPNLVFEVLRKDGVVLGYAPARSSMVTQTTEEWAQGFTGKPADDEDQRKRSYEILDVTGNAAVVKLLLDYPGWDGMDYLVLSKIDGKWMIVSKSWSGQAKPKAR